jgi:flagellar biosynthesis protein FlhB
MSEASAPEERTEEPTESRWRKLRQEGQIYQSREITQAITLIISFIILNLVLLWLTAANQKIMILCFRLTDNLEALDGKNLRQIFFRIIQEVAAPLGIVLVCSAAAAIIVTGVQTQFNVKEKKIDFKFSQLNPIAGLGRIFSFNSIIELFKAFLKLILIIPIAYFSLKSFTPNLISLLEASIAEIGIFTITSISSLFWRLISILLIIAIIDFYYGKWRWYRTNRMTKTEVKDDRKAIEGDEATKRKIRAKGLSRIVQRIMEAVPKADVVVTNPTHYAIALKYDPKLMSAPVVVAKGQGYVALRIREIAKASKVPVLERKELARALYKSTEVGSKIPYELFNAVALVISYVYKLKGKTLNK